MDTINTITSHELFSAGRWTEFLKSLSIGMTDWIVADYRDINKIRVTAHGIAKDDGRGYSVKVSKDNPLKIYIEVTGKKKQS